MKTVPYEYVNRFYGLHVTPLMRVKTSNGSFGTVAKRQSYDHYVYVKVDGQKHALPWHPLDLTYLEEDAR